MPNRKSAALASLLGAGFVLAGCSGGSDGGQTGRVSVGVSDGPVHDAEKVCITFDAIEFKHDDETILVELVPPRQVDLLAFQGMNAAPLLIAEELPAGNYQWMRLAVDAVQGTNGGAGDSGTDGVCDGVGSYAIAPTGTYNLYVPSGENNGLKLVSGFTVPANGTANFTAEFDLMKSLTEPFGLSPDVLLRPTIRLVDNVEVGHLMGTVSNELASPADCDPAVYVFDDGVMPNAIDDMEDDPVATAIVSLTDSGYEYAIGYLLEGDYEAAFTCDGSVFDPVAGEGFHIDQGQITEVNFPPAG